jgi:hypothetical protein
MSLQDIRRIIRKKTGSFSRNGLPGGVVQPFAASPPPDAHVQCSRA